MAGRRVLGVTRTVLRAAELSNRARFRAIEPSRHWLDRIEKLGVGRSRRRRAPKGSSSRYDDAAVSVSSPMFTWLKSVCTVRDPADLPVEDLPEIAVCGR